jgi:hypothetical protein
VVGIIGDTRGGYDVWGKMIAALQKTAAPDVILFSGDGVTLGPDQGEWDQWFKAAEPVLRQVPLLGAHGNHDVNSVNYYSQFAMPGDQQFYSLDYGPFHLTVLNDTTVNPSDFMTVGSKFLDDDLTAADAAGAPWKFLLHHKPMYSSAAAHGSDPGLQAAWLPIVDKHKVDVVFNGHDHDYERSKPMRGMAPQAKPTDGTTFVVAGSAGAPLYDNGTQAFTAFSQKTYNFAIVKVRPGSFAMTAYDDKGAMIDSLSYTK